MIGDGAAVGAHNVGIVEMPFGQFGQKQLARRVFGILLVIGSFPGIGLARHHEDDHRGNRRTIEIDRVDAYAVGFGKIGDCLARKGGAVAVEHHGCCGAAFPAACLQRQKLFHPDADIGGLTGDIVGDAAEPFEQLPLAAQLAQMASADGMAQIGLAVLQAFQHRPAECVGHRQRQIAANGDGAGQLGEFTLEANIGQHEKRREDLPQAR